MAPRPAAVLPPAPEAPATSTDSFQLTARPAAPPAFTPPAATTAQAESAAHPNVTIPGLPADYKGPVFISDIDGTLRDTSTVDLIRGKSQAPIFGAQDLLKQVSGLGVPIVYLSADSAAHSNQELQFLSQLPPGLLVDRDKLGLKDLIPDNKIQTQQQSNFKTSVLEQLKEAYPQAQLFGLGDDKLGDATAYGNVGAQTYIRNNDPSQTNVPAGFKGVLTDDYNSQLENRVVSDLRAAQTGKTETGVVTEPNPEPIDKARFGQRLASKLDELGLGGSEVVSDVKGRLDRIASEDDGTNPAQALRFAQQTPDLQLLQMPPAALSVLSEELLRVPAADRDAAGQQFLRVLTSHGTDAGHMDAILTHEAVTDNLSKLPSSDLQQVQKLQQASAAKPGDWNGFQTYLDNATGTVQRPGTKVEPLINGSDAFPVMLNSIDNAKSSINQTVFAFQSDQAGWEWADHLAAAADRGVAVRLLYDPAGSAKSNGQATDPAIYDFLKQHHVQVESQTPGALDDHLTHRKIMVVDGTTGYIGGMNVGDEYRDVWHDCHSKVTGPGVADLQNLFVSQWQNDGGTLSDADKASFFPPLQPVAGAGSARVIGHVGQQDQNMKLAYLRAIDTSQTSINIADPYFSDRDITNHLMEAARRGVDVNIVLPATNNHGLEEDAERSMYSEMLKSGIHVFEYTGRPMAHDKVATFDNKISTIGSSNLDARSLRDNDEANIWTSDPSVAQQVNQNLFAVDEQQSNPIDSSFKQDGVKKVLDQVGAHMFPWL